MTSGGDSSAGRDRDPAGGAWDAPVSYLDGFPEIEIGRKGFPYYVCGLCASPLQALPRSSGGVMLVCIWGCGQRFWVDV